MLESISDIKFNDIEYCILLENNVNPNFLDRLKFNIPKLMPMIPIEQPKETTISINKNILINAEETKPAASNNIKVSNYFNLKKSHNMKFPDVMNFGDRLNCFSFTGDFREARYSYINGTKNIKTLDDADTVDGWHIRVNEGGDIQFSQDGINWLNVSGGISPGNLLTQIRSIDGANSGIDADLLDGKHASEFLAANANAISATKWESPITLSLTGNITGSISLDGSTNVELQTSIGTDLQNILDEKLDSNLYTSSDILSKLLTVDGSGSTLDSDLLDGYEGSYYLNYNNFINLPELLTLGQTSSTAYRGDYGHIAYTHSQSSHAPTDAQKNSDITKSEIENKLTGLITTHTHNYISTSEKGVANGVALLDSSGKIVDSQLPSIVLTDTHVKNSETEQLALNIQQGDVCVRTDLSKSFIALNSNNQSMADWQELLSPSSSVESVNGKVGAVVLTYSDVGALGASQTAISAHKWESAIFLTLTGDVSGEISIDGSGDVELSVTINDNSHAHEISNITGLETALNNRLLSTSYTAEDILVKLLTVDGHGTGLNADLLDGNHASDFAMFDHDHDDIYLNKNDNAVSASKWQTARTLTISGDLSGSVTFDGSEDITIHTSSSTSIDYPEVTEYANIFPLSPTVVQGTMKGKYKGATHQNLLKNGNFANGTTGWSATGGTMSVSNGNLVFEASAVAEEHYALQALPIPIAGHKYYFTAKNLANVEWSIIIYNFNGDGQYEAVPSPTIQTAGRLSVCITPSSVNATPYFFIRLYCKTGETANFNDVQVYDLTAEGLTTLTDAQLAQKFSHYIDGMQSVQPQEIKSIGKNKFNLYAELERINPSNAHLVTEEGRNCVKVTYPASYYQKKILDGWFKPLTQYTFKMTYKHVGTYGGLYINIRYTDGEVVETMDGTVGSFYTTTITSAAGKSISYIELSYGGSNEITYFDIDICQIEEGTTATTYEPYTESKAYLKYPLRSVPNGTCDEVDLQSGKLTKRCEEIILKSEDITLLSTGYTTVDIVVTKVISDISIQNTVSNHFSVSEGWGKVTASAWTDSTNNANTVYINGVGNAVFTVAKGTYANLAAAQAALAGAKIVYQLAEPQAIENALTNPLTVYPSGTITMQPKKQYVLKTEDIASLFIGYSNMDAVLINKKFDSVDYGNINIQQGQTEIDGFIAGTYADSAATVGKFFTVDEITYALVVSKGTYTTLAEAQADLAGTIITYDTKPELSTIPVTVHSEPVNIAAAVKSESDRNTRQDEQIRNHIYSSGSDHAYINQDVTTTASPTFKKITIDNSSVGGDGGWDDCAVILKNNHATAGECSVAFQNVSTGSNYWKMGLNQNSSLAFNYGTAFSDAGTIMTITADGKVGLGPVNPGYRLVVDKITTDAPAIMVGGALYGGPQIQIYDLVANANAWMGLGTDMGVGNYEHSIYFPSYSNGKLTFGTYDGTTYTEKMRLTKDGEVSITGSISVPSLGVSSVDGTSGGISLYGGPNFVTTFGLAFRTTANQGTHGYVYGDWATYMFTDNSWGRGWIWRNSGTTTNVASIDNQGRAVMKSYKTGNYEMVHNATEDSLDFIYFG